ncbi:hypothetical protein D3C74_234040 [compost metagenome]
MSSDTPSDIIWCLSDIIIYLSSPTFISPTLSKGASSRSKVLINSLAIFAALSSSVSIYITLKSTLLWTFCTGLPSIIWNEVRKDSCLSTSSLKACSKRSLSSLPSISIIPGMLYAIPTASSWFRIYSLFWADEIG